jgi:hypothetical protein
MEANYNSNKVLVLGVENKLIVPKIPIARSPLEVGFENELILKLKLVLWKYMELDRMK